jgi:hypothetical protein
MTPSLVLLIVRLILAAVLYLFLAWLLYTQWMELRTAHRMADVAPAARIVAIDGMLPGKAFALAPMNDVGRAADNSILLEDETVSSHHARIFYHAGQWWLEDLASRNGTDVNELQVEEPLVVTYGDEIRFGRIRVKLEAGD